MSNLWERSIWRNNEIDFIFGSKIVEYDMKSAGFNIIKYFKLVPDSTIKELEKLAKHTRHIKIGLMQKKDREFSNRLSDAFKAVRRMFFEANNLNESNLLSIKKDAFFVIDTPCKHTKFGNIEFDTKNKYSSYVLFNKLEFYIDTLTNYVDIKGLGQGETLEEIRELHDEHMLKFICTFARMEERRSPTIELYVTKFIRDYRNRNLPIGYYRELTTESAYRVYSDEVEDYINIKDTDDIANLDIRFNYMNYIVPLANICL